MNHFQLSFHYTLNCLNILTNERTDHMGKILWTIIVILFVIWLIGFIADIAGGLIHLILVVAGIIFIVQLVLGKRSL